MIRLGVLLVLAAAALASAAGADTPTLQGSVGPAFTISLTDSSGSAVTHLDPGAYGVHVVDQGDIHDFHLVGPGVNKKTGIAFKGTVTWTVTLRAGKYAFRSDAHRALHGTLTVS